MFIIFNTFNTFERFAALLWHHNADR